MTTSGGTPPGWYDVGDGWMRYFDGTAWTEHVERIDLSRLDDVEETVPAAVRFGADDDVDRGVASQADPVEHETEHATENDAEREELRRRIRFGALVGAVVLMAAAGLFLLVTAADDDPGSSPSPGAVGATTVAPTATRSPTAAKASPTASSTSSRRATTGATPTVRATGAVDGDWELVSFRATRAEFTGDFSGTARIRYRGTDADAANNFTITLFKGDKRVGTLQGPIASIGPGQTATVPFISTDEYVAGPYRVTFRKDL